MEQNFNPDAFAEPYRKQTERLADALRWNAIYEEAIRDFIKLSEVMDADSLLKHSLPALRRLVNHKR